MNAEQFLENRGKFKQVSRTHDCEIPKGNCWRIVVEERTTGDRYEYYEEDCYSSLKDQSEESPEGLGFTKLTKG